jgi:hypothetical protein
VTRADDIDRELAALNTLISRLHASMSRTDRECMGLHAGLSEAVHRLRGYGADVSDLLLVLDDPGSAPLTYPRERFRKLRTLEENAEEYVRIFKPEDC